MFLMSPPPPSAWGAQIVKLNVLGCSQNVFRFFGIFLNKFFCFFVFWQNVIVKLKRPIVKLKRPF